MQVLSIIRIVSIIISLVFLIISLILLLTAKNRASYMKFLMAHVGIEILLIFFSVILSFIVRSNMAIYRITNIIDLIIMFMGLILFGFGLFLGIKDSNKVKGIIPLSIYFIMCIIDFIYIIISGKIFEVIISSSGLDPIVVISFLNSLRFFGSLVGYIVLIIGIVLIGKSVSHHLDIEDGNSL